jgi:hypothetical protein
MDLTRVYIAWVHRILIGEFPKPRMATMGQLFKQLFRALGQFLWFHVKSPFGPRTRPVATPIPANSAATLLSTLPTIGLDHSYERLVQWPTWRGETPPREVADDPLYQLWRTTSGGHKWSQYFEAYEAVFSARRGASLRVLEIGVYAGSSLQLWRKYFAHPDTLVVGVDIREECKRYDAPADGIRVRVGSQADVTFLASVVAEFGPFDIVIDDGSHYTSHQITSFNALFGPGLTDDGIYVVEDLHCNYWRPWRDSSNSFIDLCMGLVNRMHEHYRSTSHAAFFAGLPESHFLPAIEVPGITTILGEVRFFDSIIAIHKRRREFVPYHMMTLP